MTYTNSYVICGIILGVTLVAMVTKDIEGGRVKCHRYWPDSLDTAMNINDS